MRKRLFIRELVRKLDTFNKDQETSCQPGLIGVTGRLGAQWPRWRQCLLSEGQLRTPTAYVMSTRGQTLCPSQHPGCWPLAGQPGSSKIVRAVALSLGPLWYLPPPQEKSRVPAALSVPPTQALGKCLTALARRGRRQGMTWGLPEWKAGVWMGCPQSLTHLPHCQGPRLPLGSSLRNRRMSADGKVSVLETVCSVLSPVPGDVSSFPHSCLNVRRGLKDSVFLVCRPFCVCSCLGVKPPRVSLGDQHGAFPPPQIWLHASPRAPQRYGPDHFLG